MLKTFYRERNALSNEKKRCWCWCCTLVPRRWEKLESNFFQKLHFTDEKYFSVQCNQCYQIGRYIGLWATFQSLWQQFICPNLLHSQAIFVKVPKSLIFSSCFWATFIDIWRFFTGHTGCNRMFFHFIIIIITTILWVLWFSTGMDLPQRSLIEGDVAQGVSYGVY